MYPINEGLKLQSLKQAEGHPVEVQLEPGSYIYKATCVAVRIGTRDPIHSDPCWEMDIQGELPNRGTIILRGSEQVAATIPGRGNGQP